MCVVFLSSNGKFQFKYHTAKEEKNKGGGHIKKCKQDGTFHT